MTVSVQHANNTGNVEEEFREAMSNEGVHYIGPIIADGQIHRIHVEGDKAARENGWYVLFADGIPSGAFGTWKDGAKNFHKWCARASRKLTDDEKREHRERIARAKRERAAEQKQRHAEAATSARELLGRSKTANTNHPYLVCKGISPNGIRQDNGKLLISVESIEGEIAGLQTIDDSGTKLFTAGTAKHGNFHAIGDLNDGTVLYVCEGYATGATIYEAVGRPVAVAFDAGNLKPVAEKLHAKYPSTQIVICGDNDANTHDNPGVKYANKAAEAVGASVAIPKFRDDESGSDFNDLAALHGLDAVRDALGNTQPKPPRAGGYATDGASFPEIKIEDGQLPAMTDAAIAALQAAGVPIFSRGGKLVRPVKTKAKHAQAGVRRNAGTLVLKYVDKDWLRRKLAEVAVWTKWIGGKHKPAHPHKDIVDAIIGIPDHGDWPPLTGIARHPVLFEDGRRTTKNGYDAESGLFIDAMGDWPNIPELPTKADAIAAREKIEYLLRFFPYATETDRAVALSMLLTAVMRPALRVAPGHAMDASAPGSGKSLHVDAAAVLATGDVASVIEYSAKEEEVTKRLDGVLMAGDPFIAFDNIEAPLRGASLCSTLTQTTRKIRVLGSNTEILDVPCVAALVFTGNNLVVQGDIVRRVLISRLNPNEERPEQRSIPQDLLAEVRDRRGEIVAALHTIVAAYIAASKPNLNLSPFGSFEQWSRLVRCALVFSGATDPVKSMNQTFEDDPKRVERMDVFRAWRGAYGDEYQTAKCAIAKAVEDKELQEALEAVCDTKNGLDTRKLGNWLRRNQGCIADRMILQKEGGPRTNAGVKWRVAVLSNDFYPTKSVSSDSCVSISVNAGKNVSEEMINLHKGTKTHTQNTLHTHPGDPEDFEERAAIMEFDAGLTRGEAEQRASAGQGM